MKDIRSIDRGKCLNCHECEEFTGTLRCDYCDCVAAKHIRKQEEEAITGDESNKHFKLDTLEHSGHSDVGLTSLTSGFENLEENCVEEVSNGMCKLNFNQVLYFYLFVHNKQRFTFRGRPFDILEGGAGVFVSDELFVFTLCQSNVIYFSPRNCLFSAFARTSYLFSKPVINFQNPA